MNIQKMMKDAQRMQEELQAKLAGIRVDGSAGGGIVRAVMDGQKNLLSVAIAKEAVDPDDLEMLQDLVVAAVAEASRRADEESQSAMSGLIGGLGGGLAGGLPGGFKIPGPS